VCHTAASRTSAPGTLTGSLPNLSAFRRARHLREHRARKEQLTVLAAAPTSALLTDVLKPEGSDGIRDGLIGGDELERGAARYGVDYGYGSATEFAAALTGKQE
jgi:hypothetical protein